MRIGVVQTLFIGIFVWNIFGMELRLCGNKPDDRIIFPNDDKRKYIQNSTQNIVNPNSTQSVNVTTSTTESYLETSTDSSIEEDDSNSTTIEPIAVDNRILLDTLPMCQPGFQLRAGHCRKDA